MAFKSRAGMHGPDDGGCDRDSEGETGRRGGADWEVRSAGNPCRGYGAYSKP